MDRIFLHDRIVLFQFKPFRGILLILFADVATCAGKTGCLVLCALEDHLHPASFLCHFVYVLLRPPTCTDASAGKASWLMLDFVTLFPQLLDHGIKTVLVDRADPFG